MVDAIKIAIDEDTVASRSKGKNVSSVQVHMLEKN